MNRFDFQKLTQKVLVLDGASGTLMQENNMPLGTCPEIFAMENRDVLKNVQRQYYEAGSNVVYTFTFGGNSLKLSKYNVAEDKVHLINKTLAQISCEVRDEFQQEYPERNFLVAGDLAPTGEYLQPIGDLSFDDLKQIYKQQAMGLLDGGVDFFVIETMMDLAQAKCAVLAIKEICDLPIMVTMTFEKNKTMSGNSPIECLVTLQSLNISAFGANCSSGPVEMIDTMKDLYKISNIPLIAKPNAGMPIKRGEETVFPMGPIDFSNEAIKFCDERIYILGGCCGTTPLHIKELGERVDGYNNVHCNQLQIINNDITAADMISSQRESLVYNNSLEYEVIKCNSNKDIDKIIDNIFDAMDNEPDFVVIDFTEYEKSDEYAKDKIKETFNEINMSIFLPLGIISKSIDTIFVAGEIYTGRIAFFASNLVDELAVSTAKKYGMKIIENKN